MPRLPQWLKQSLPKGNANHFTERLLETLHLETVCDHAKCPNRMECYARKTATFLLMGPVCTRNCRFCSVPTGTPAPLDAEEPNRVASAVKTLGLSHVVLTCVSRDDLPDGGAAHFGQTIDAIRATFASETCPTIEVLPSDFAGNWVAVDHLANKGPDVYNYNTETVPRLFREIRGMIPDYDRTLNIFRRIQNKHPTILLKSGMMLGLGETDDEIRAVLADLFEAGCRVITLGQYLQPTPQSWPVDRYVAPEEFDRWKEWAQKLGFASVASAPFVRSSYRAAEALNHSPLFK